jgi:CBS domain-containing protein
MKLEELCARDIMTTKIVEANREETLRTAIKRMADHGIHGVLIAPTTPRHGYCILTGKDCIEVLCDAGEDALDALCVEDAMTRPAVTIPAGLCLADCIQMMRRTGVRMAPVVDSGELVGILTFTDVLRVCL